MTPLKVELLLWYYCSSEDFPRILAPAVQDAIDEFCEAGIFKRQDVITDLHKKIWCNQSALDVYVKAVLDVPAPKQVWVCEK
jgi:hypothetical protein